MTWTDVKQKWWHRFAIAVTFLLPPASLATCLIVAACRSKYGLDMPKDMGFAIVVIGFALGVCSLGIWAAYRLVLWIVLGRIPK